LLWLAIVRGVLLAGVHLSRGLLLVRELWGWMTHVLVRELVRRLAGMLRIDELRLLELLNVVHLALVDDVTGDSVYRRTSCHAFGVLLLRPPTPWAWAPGDGIRGRIKLSR
jgi:hypothetical protein